mmetsp:Transcript_23066/g.57383  ORF Transcript_23066/g.57383 Transcript_23066/m.57383 type:complete len:189 (+) Transcript_23066:388-954(+)
MRVGILPDAPSHVALPPAGRAARRRGVLCAWQNTPMQHVQQPACMSCQRQRFSFLKRKACDRQSPLGFICDGCRETSMDDIDEMLKSVPADQQSKTRIASSCQTTTACGQDHLHLSQKQLGSGGDETIVGNASSSHKLSFSVLAWTRVASGGAACRRVDGVKPWAKQSLDAASSWYEDIDRLLGHHRR